MIDTQAKETGPQIIWQNLGLRVACFASVPQDEPTFHFNLINERCLAIQVVRDAECHMTTTEPMVLLPLSLSLSHSLTAGLGVIPCSDAWSEAAVFGRNQ